MPKKRFSAEQIVTLLRQIEVVDGAGQLALEACREAGDLGAELRDELLNSEIFYSLKEAQIVIGQWRKHYNTIRLHSALGYRPPAPQTFAPLPGTGRWDHANAVISIALVQKIRQVRSATAPT